MESVQGGVQMGSKRIKSFRKPMNFHSSRNKSEKDSGSWENILDPQGSFLQYCNKIFLLACIIALALDPLFFYVPVAVNRGTYYCLDLDGKLEIIACILRTFTDAFYIIHMIFQFRTRSVADPSGVVSRGKSIDDPWAIAKRYLSTYFIIDVLAILPLPQLLILPIIPSLKGPIALVKKEWLRYIIICQSVPRIVRIFVLCREVNFEKYFVTLTETTWAGAALNVFLYMLTSHVLGAIWYLISIERLDQCLGDASRLHGYAEFLWYCDDDKGQNASNARLLTQLMTYCPLINPDDITNSTVFNFGIFIEAFQSGIVDSRHFSLKFLYCFWWGLRNLSSLGSNLNTSAFTGEILLAIVISIAGFVLLTILFGIIQIYLRSTGVKRIDAEQWMKHRKLPEELRERIRRYEQRKLQETRRVEEESLISCFPRGLRLDIKRHLCLDPIMRVPLFEKMDDQLLDAMCDRLKRALYSKKTYIVREGEPVEEMLFIIRGNLVSTTTNGGMTGFFNAVYLKAGDFCGEALLPWALDPQSSSHQPISTRTVQALSEVEAFALLADDLKCVASQFRCLHSKQFQNTFRFYSVQWRTWAASFIQAAWRQYCRRKLLKLLRAEEARLQNALADDSGLSPSVGASIYVSRFAANALRNVR